MHLVLIGPPGSGKTTLAQSLAEHFNMHHLSTGKLFRDIRKDDMRWTKKLQKIPPHAYVPDDLTNTIVQEYIGTKGAVLFDGYPRTSAQLDFVQKNIPVTAYIYLELAEDQAKTRLLARTDRPEHDVIEERFADFARLTLPMVGQIPNLVHIDANHDQKTVFNLTLKELKNFLTKE